MASQVHFLHSFGFDEPSSQNLILFSSIIYSYLLVKNSRPVWIFHPKDYKTSDSVQVEFIYFFKSELFENSLLCILKYVYHILKIGKIAYNLHVSTKKI